MHMTLLQDGTVGLGRRWMGSSAIRWVFGVDVLNEAAARVRLNAYDPILRLMYERLGLN